MRFVKRAIIFTTCLAAVAVACVAAIDPGGYVRGVLHEEPFYLGRPLNVWRLKLAEAVDRPGADAALLKDFRVNPLAGFPIIRAAATDPDAKVRRAAVWLAASLNNENLLPTLTHALEDEEGGLRLMAAEGLGRLRVYGRPAMPSLALALNDSEPQVRAEAENALWHIHRPSAADACHWQTVRLADGAAEVLAPPDGKAAEDRAQTPFGESRRRKHDFEHMAAVFTAVIHDLPPGAVRGLADRDRLNELRDGLLVSTFGEMLEERTVEQSGLSGFETRQKIDRDGTEYVARRRGFWDGNRCYTLLAIYKPERGFVSLPAVDHFLESFRVVTRVESAAGESGRTRPEQ